MTELVAIGFLGGAVSDSRASADPPVAAMAATGGSHSHPWNAQAQAMTITELDHGRTVSAPLGAEVDVRLRSASNATWLKL